jgi:Tfp pilus assembly protein PilF
MAARTNRLLWTLALVTLVCLAYLPAMSAGFIWDDDNYVTHNSALHNVAGLRAIWTDPRSTPQYYPLVHSLFWIEYQAWGLRPAGYHVVNILLHAANAILLWRLLAMLKIPAPWMAAAVFALHPVHVESVAWITERKNVLSGFFYLAAAITYCRFAFPSDATVGQSIRWRSYALSIFCFVAALLSKTVTVTLPAALLLIVWWRRGRISIRDAWPLLPMLVIGIPFSMMTVWLERHHVGAIGADWQFTFVDRFLIAGRALWFYAGKLVWPTPLIFIYPRWQIDSTAWWQFAFPLSAIGVIIFLARRGRLTGPLVALLLYAGTLFPALGFFDIFPMRYSFVADHFQYLASIGLIVLAVASGHGLMQRMQTPWLPRLVAGLVLGILMAMTWRQSGIYRDRETLWRDTLAKNPSCPMAHHNLGNVLVEQGRLVEASIEFRRAIQLDPGDTLARLNLANVRSEQGRFGEALEQFELILKLDPREARAHYNMANVLDRLQRQEEAERHYRQALEIAPTHPEARLNLATLMMQQGRWNQAEVELRELLRISPASYLAHCNLAALYHHRGDPERALVHARQALRIAPNAPESKAMLEHVQQN